MVRSGMAGLPGEVYPMKRWLALVLFILSPILGFGQSTQGNLTAASTVCQTVGSCVTFDLPNIRLGGAIQLDGTFAGTVQFEGSTNSGNWFAIVGTPIGGGAASSSATAIGIWQFGIAGLNGLRARASVYTSGTVNVTIAATDGVSPYPTTVAQGAAGTAPWLATLQASTLTQCPTTAAGTNCAVGLAIQGMTGGIPAPITSGGNPILIYAAGLSNSAASTITSTVQTILTSAFTIDGIFCNNASVTTAPNWVQLFDVASGTAVTLGTTVPTFSFPVTGNEPSFVTRLDLQLANGLKVAATTTPAGATTASSAVPWCNFTKRSILNGF